MAVPPALKEWFASVLRRTPPQFHPGAPGEVLSALADGGAGGGDDFTDVGVEELRDVWPCLRSQPNEFLAGLSAKRRAAAAAPVGCSQGRANHDVLAAPAAHGCIPQVRQPMTEAALTALGFLAAARLRGALLDPKELADAVQALGRATPEELQLAWARRRVNAPGNPRERAAQLKDNMSQFDATQELLRRELGG